MIRNLLSKSLLCGAAAVLAVLTVTPQAADAATARVRFTPPYGSPFPDLEWFGEAVISDGTCTATGNVSNLFGPCSGQFSFVSATLNFAKVSAPTTVLQSFNLTGSTVAEVQRSTTAAPDWTQIISSPFSPVQGAIPETMYGSGQAYFSLVFVGGYAQLIWFKDNPGSFLDSVGSLATYAGCYLSGPGDNAVAGTHCGLSSNLQGAGAKLTVTAVPEPSTYAMFFAGLGALAFVARRRRGKV